MPLEIRVATSDDAEAVARMHHASWVEAYTSLLPAEAWRERTVERWIASWRQNLTAPAPGVTTIAAFDGAGGVRGFATRSPGRAGDDGSPPPRSLELVAMYVLAAEYGTGLAARLLDTAIPPATPAFLWVFEANPRARAFYTKHGFAPDGARHRFGPELGDQPEIRMLR